MLRARERLLHVVVVVFVVVLVVVLVVVFVVVVVVGIRGSAVQEEVLSILLILSREKSVVHIPRIGVEHVVLGVSLARHERAVSPLVQHPNALGVAQGQVRDGHLLKPRHRVRETGRLRAQSFGRRTRVVSRVLEARRGWRNVDGGDGGDGNGRFGVVVPGVGVYLLQLENPSHRLWSGHRGERPSVRPRRRLRLGRASLAERRVKRDVVSRTFPIQVRERRHENETFAGVRSREARLRHPRARLVVSPRASRRAFPDVSRVARRAEVEASTAGSVRGGVGAGAVGFSGGFGWFGSGGGDGVIAAVVVRIVDEAELRVVRGGVAAHGGVAMHPAAETERAAAFVTRAAPGRGVVGMASDRLAVVARACARSAARVTPALAAWDAKRLVHIEGRVAEVRHGFVECADVVDVVASRVRAWGVGGGGARIVARAAGPRHSPGEDARKHGDRARAGGVRTFAARSQPELTRRLVHLRALRGRQPCESGRVARVDALIRDAQRERLQRRVPVRRRVHRGSVVRSHHRRDTRTLSASVVGAGGCARAPRLPRRVVAMNFSLKAAPRRVSHFLLS